MDTKFRMTLMSAATFFTQKLYNLNSVQNFRIEAYWSVYTFYLKSVRYWILLQLLQKISYLKAGFEVCCSFYTENILPEVCTVLKSAPALTENILTEICSIFKHAAYFTRKTFDQKSVRYRSLLQLLHGNNFTWSLYGTKVCGSFYRNTWSLYGIKVCCSFYTENILPEVWAAFTQKIYYQESVRYWGMI